MKLAVPLIVTSLELFALAAAHGVGFYPKCASIKMPSKKPAQWCYSGNEAIMYLEANLSHA